MIDQLVATGIQYYTDIQKRSDDEIILKPEIVMTLSSNWTS